MSWQREHAIDSTLARAAGVSGERGGVIRFRYGKEFVRLRFADGSMRNPVGERLRLYWPCGDGAASVLLCEGEGDTLAAASVLCRVDRAGEIEPRSELPGPLPGICPVGMPGAQTPTRVVVGEFIAAGVVEAFICLDGDEAGRLATSRIVEALREASIKTVPVWLGDDLDLADFLRDAGDIRVDALGHLLADAEIAAVT